jgi:hypothetical protein
VSSATTSEARSSVVRVRATAAKQPAPVTMYARPLRRSHEVGSSMAATSCRVPMIAATRPAKNITYCRT